MNATTANTDVNANLLTDDEQCEPLTGTPYFTAVPVSLSPVTAAPVVALSTP
jgi:hypothetical protein